MKEAHCTSPAQRFCPTPNCIPGEVCIKCTELGLAHDGFAVTSLFFYPTYLWSTTTHLPRATWPHSPSAETKSCWKRRCISWFHNITVICLVGKNLSVFRHWTQVLKRIQSLCRKVNTIPEDTLSSLQKYGWINTSRKYGNIQRVLEAMFIAVKHSRGPHRTVNIVEVILFSLKSPAKFSLPYTVTQQTQYMQNLSYFFMFLQVR